MGTTSSFELSALPQSLESETDKASEGTRAGGESVRCRDKAEGEVGGKDIEQMDRGDGEGEVVAWMAVIATAADGQSSSISSSAEEKLSRRGLHGAPRSRGEEKDEGEDVEEGGTNEGAGGGGKAAKAPASSSSREAGVRHACGGGCNVSPFAGEPCVVVAVAADPNPVADSTPNEAVVEGVGEEDACRKPSSSRWWSCGVAGMGEGAGKGSGRSAPSCLSSSWMRRSMLLMSTRRCRLGSLSARWLYSFSSEMLKMVCRWSV